MKKFLAVLLATLMVVSIVACGGSTTTKYVAKSMSLSGYELSWEEAGGEECYIELGSDGSCSFLFNGELATGTYTLNGEDIVYSISGDETTGTLSGSTLTMDLTSSDEDLGDITFAITFEQE